MFQQIATPVLLAATALMARPVIADSPLERIAFGSCLRQDREQAIYEPIRAQRPEVFVFLGDNIYGDTRDMARLRAIWDQFRAVPGHRALREEARVLATWDDHDYGQNDAGAEYGPKAESQRLFLEAFDVPKDRGPWKREGIYDAYGIGPEGREVQIILLDTRYFRDPLIRHDLDVPAHLGRYGPNPDRSATLLGEAQWAWLEAKLKEPAALRLIASSIQVLPVQHYWERWENFPHERRRLFRLLKETGARNTVFLSGDRHLAEIMRLPAEDPAGPGWPIYEITSSSLNQPISFTRGEPNRFRVGESYRQANFGTLEIDWEARGGPSVRLAIRDTGGEVVRETRVDF